MKQSVSPVTAIVVILVVVILIAAIAYFAVIKPSTGGQKMPKGEFNQVKDKMKGQMEKMIQQKSKMKGGKMGPMGGPPPGR